MKNTRFCIVCVVLSLVLGACSSNPKVTRVSADTQTDLSGYWNDTDVRIVCDSLIKSCLESPMVAAEIARRGGKKPVFLVGPFWNDSADEHIPTAIISDTMEVAIFESGKATFVAGGAVRDALRAERQDQQNNASEATAKSLLKETGADFLLTGTVRSMVERAGKTTTRTYFVRAELSDIETNERLWMGQNSEIKKIIKTSGVKL